MDISIPLWCDWKWFFASLFRNVINISIPLWCDWKVVKNCSIPNVINISIPLWCDWKLHIYFYTRFICLFQFLYGAIGSILLIALMLAGCAFQFLYGAIGRKIQNGMLSSKNNFNSFMVRLEGDARACIIT